MGHWRNILIITARGLRADVAGDTPSWPFVAPNMETLANKGVRLTAISAAPTHAGGMASLLTGLHARQHGHLHDGGDSGHTGPPAAHGGEPACDGFPAWLAMAGYHVAGVGLVGAACHWLDDCTLVEPLDTINPRRCAYAQVMRDKGYFPAIVQQRRQRLRAGLFEPDRLLLEPDEDVDGYIAATAEAMLRRMPEHRPWALWVAFTGPGNDLPPPGMYDQLVRSADVESGFQLPDFRNLDALGEPQQPRSLLQRMDAARLGRIRADYLGRVALVDHGVGRLRQALSQRPDQSRVWTVLASDHGLLLGEHGLVGHRSFLAGAVETPLMLTPPPRVPGGDAPAARPIEHSDGLVSTVDMAATVAALGGCDVPAATAGRSLLPVFSDEAPNTLAGRLGAISECGQRLMIETERHKMVVDVESFEPLALFDLLADPDELVNLVDTPAGRNHVDALRFRIAAALLPLRAKIGAVRSTSAQSAARHMH
jgi:arylsulfatase A-like enzyme